jgi:glycosyltransferase involved in cell wall biosynthesis
MAELILSVIVPSYNSEKHIEATLKSLERGQHPQVEFIFMDGGSKDGTMAIVERYKTVFSKIISEPDEGQSDAFNKGYQLAKGKFITWVNSDDLMNASALPKVVDYLKNTQSEWVVANSAYIDKEGQVMRCCRSGGFEHVPVKLGLLNVFGPSTFVTKELYARMGAFSKDFHFCMDTEYWWRIAQSGCRYERVQCYFWGLRLHADAKTAGVLLNNVTPPRMQEEGKIMHDRYYPSVSPKMRRFGVWVARLYRVLNGSLLISILDTRRFKGKPFSSLEEL